MIEDVCKEEIWRGPQGTVVSIQPWDLDKSPKPNLQQWAPKEEEAVWNQELAPKYEEGWFEALFPDVLEVQKAPRVTVFKLVVVPSTLDTFSNLPALLLDLPGHEVAAASA
jgi:hypothetical protein